MVNKQFSGKRTAAGGHYGQTPKPDAGDTLDVGGTLTDITPDGMIINYENPERIVSENSFDVLLTESMPARKRKIPLSDATSSWSYYGVTPESPVVKKLTYTIFLAEVKYLTRESRNIVYPGHYSLHGKVVISMNQDSGKYERGLLEFDSAEEELRLILTFDETEPSHELVRK